jgi:hypothetical protein
VLVIARDTYREVGVRNRPTIVPLDLVAGLAERATPGMAKNIAHGYARHDIRTHCEVLREAHRCPPPRATAERIAKALAEAAESDVVNVVNMRTKRSGQRWSVSGRRGALNLRALLKSERLAQFWTVFSRRYTANVSSLAVAA